MRDQAEWIEFDGYVGSLRSKNEAETYSVEVTAWLNIRN